MGSGSEILVDLKIVSGMIFVGKELRSDLRQSIFSSNMHPCLLLGEFSAERPTWQLNGSTLGVIRSAPEAEQRKSKTQYL